MYKKELQDELFESLLKAAVIENALEEMDEWIDDETIVKEIEVPKSYDDRVMKTYHKMIKKQTVKKWNSYSKKVAVILLVVVSGVFGLLLQSDKVRAACYQVIVEFCDKYVGFDFNSFSESPKKITVGYIPEGYVEIENKTDEFAIYIMYQNEQEDKIILQYLFHSPTVQIDDEHYVITSYKNNTEYLFLSLSEDFPNILLWYDDTGCYMLQGHLEKEELFKIRENIK